MKILVDMDTAWAFSVERLLEDVRRKVKATLPWKGDIVVDFGYTRDESEGRHAYIKLAVIKWYELGDRE